MTATADLSTVTVVPLSALADDWLIHLNAQGKSRQTIKTYSAGVGSFMRWHRETFPDAEPVIDRKTVELWLVDLRNADKADGTRRLWFNALRLFTKWMADPDIAELDRDPLANMKPPPAGQARVLSVPDDEIERMIKACKGTRFADRRDKALVLVLASTGLRAAECCALTLDDVDLKTGRIYVAHGKGDRERKAPLVPEAADAVAAYLRARRQHPRAHASKQLWLGEVQHPTFGTQGLRRALGNRAQAAGIAGFHPHRLRHSFASRLARAGFNDDEIMALGGWRDATVARAYRADTVAERAMAKAETAGLGKFTK